MIARTLTAIVSSMAAVVLVAATGCSVSPESNQAFVALVKRVKALEENQKNSLRTVDTLAYDLETMDRDMQALKKTLSEATLAGTSEESAQRLEDALGRVEGMAKRIDELSKRVAEQNKAMERMAAKVAENARKPARVVDGSAERSAASPRRGASKTTRASSPPRLSQVSRSKLIGTYHKVQPGDTLHQVARRYNVSSAELCRANHIPMSALLYPGQQIYIPRI